MEKRGKYATQRGWETGPAAPAPVQAAATQPEPCLTWTRSLSASAFFGSMQIPT